MSQGYIIHWGIKGQLWGRRRYQYEDGSLTPEGRRRYGVGKRREGASYVIMKSQNVKQSSNAGQNKNQPSTQNGQSQQQPSQEKRLSQEERQKRINSISGESGKIFNEVGKIREKDANERFNKKVNEDLGNMTDEELRERVARMGLERSYRSLARESTPSERSRAAKFIEYAGSALAIAGSAVSIAVAIKELRGGD